METTDFLVSIAVQATAYTLIFIGIAIISRADRGRKKKLKDIEQQAREVHQLMEENARMLEDIIQQVKQNRETKERIAQMADKWRNN